MIIDISKNFINSGRDCYSFPSNFFLWLSNHFLVLLQIFLQNNSEVRHVRGYYFPSTITYNFNFYNYISKLHGNHSLALCFFFIMFFFLQLSNNLLVFQFFCRIILKPLIPERLIFSSMFFFYRICRNTYK